MSFTIFQNEKTPFQAIKTRSLKSGKIVNFLKGLVHAFGQKLTIFPSFFFFLAIQTRNMCFTIFQNEKIFFLSYKNKKFKKWKNCHFSKGVSPWFWSKIGHFSKFFPKAIQQRKMCFQIFQDEKTPFQAIKARPSKSRKIVIFAKGLVHGFGQKLAIFPNVFLRQYGRGKCVFRYSRTKKRLSRL